MKLSNEDQVLLKELCEQHEVNHEKILKLLDTTQEYEFKERRVGIYEALRDILKSDFKKNEDSK